MASWPGWNSIENAHAWSNFYFWLGIFALILVGACEFVSHRYSLRKDELVASAQEQLNTRVALNNRRNEATMAQLRQDLATAQRSPAAPSAQRTAAAAAQPASGSSSQPQRHLTETEKREILDAIASFDGQAVTVSSLSGDSEGANFRNDFAGIFQKAHWAVAGHIGEIGLDTDQTGVAVAMDKSWIEAGHTLPKAGVALINVLAKLNILAAKNLMLIGNLPPGRIVLVVGTRPR